jgi:hypothetical protein
MDAQRLSTTPPGAHAATHRGESRRPRPPRLTGGARALTAAFRPGAVTVTCARPLARTEARPYPPLLRPGRSPAGPVPKTQVGSP